MSSTAQQRSPNRFTFRGNIETSRHGWLRLTPAYSVHLVRELLDDLDQPAPRVLDPFCGTGTTLVASAERGLDCATVDLNPFLVWLARAKAASYTAPNRAAGRRLIEQMARAARTPSTRDGFVPPIHQVEKWWAEAPLAALSRAHGTLTRSRRDPRALDLGRLALCQSLIGVANVSFGHQSMSFKKRSQEPSATAVSDRLLQAAERLATTAATERLSGRRTVRRGDARSIARLFPDRRFDLVITSPPYPNRMSYIRELRPYMYWLGYLTDRSQAGRLDWQAIGGTWGIATSKLAAWQPDPDLTVPHDGFDRIVQRIDRHQPLLSRYVHKYFQDMLSHARALVPLLAPGAAIHYIVGNSKFYDVLVPVERIFASLFESVGLGDVQVQKLRKRTSKRELFEYRVSARAR